MKLGVNIDHIATLRNARGENDPSVIAAAMICELSGADGITVHLREDRRHIKDEDLFELKRVLRLPLNLEMALNQDVLNRALEVKPYMCTIVPEKREEITTEGGLDVEANLNKVKNYVRELKNAGIIVSLFVEAEEKVAKLSAECGADFVEIHTGRYSRVFYNEKEKMKELEKFENFIKECVNLGIRVNAGHGLNYQNVREIVKFKEIEELNIGHSIISRAVFSGLDKAVYEMKRLIGG
jgi:pyridoxine 5-phosphate synthase